MADKKIKKTKKVRKVVSEANVFITASFNNTIMSATEPNGNVLAQSSAGANGFKGTRKSTPYAATVTAEMKTSVLARSKTGKKWPSLPNRSSAAGESPATQSGKLASSIRAILSPDKTEAFVGVPNSANVNYAKWLEYGTRRIAPRPFVFVALQKNKKSIKDMYVKALKL